MLGLAIVESTQFIPNNPSHVRPQRREVPTSLRQFIAVEVIIRYVGIGANRLAENSVIHPHDAERSNKHVSNNCQPIIGRAN
jgi:hypothetical protein